MTLTQLFKKIAPFVRPYRTLVFATLILTLIGLLMAQVNAHILRYTVDELNQLVGESIRFAQGGRLILYISIVLLTKEVIYAFIQFGQKFYGEKLRIFISRDFAQKVVDRIFMFTANFYIVLVSICIIPLYFTFKAEVCFKS